MGMRIRIRIRIQYENSTENNLYVSTSYGINAVLYTDFETERMFHAEVMIRRIKKIKASRYQLHTQTQTQTHTHRHIPGTFPFARKIFGQMVENKTKI